MSDLIRIASVGELPAEGEAREFACGDQMVCVARVNGELSAMDNVCVHRGGPLGQGVVMDGKLFCPWHGWAYTPATGKSVHDPDAGVAVYRLKIEGDDVMVER